MIIIIFIPLLYYTSGIIRLCFEPLKNTLIILCELLIVELKWLLLRVNNKKIMFQQIHSRYRRSIVHNNINYTLVISIPYTPYQFYNFEYSPFEFLTITNYTSYAEKKKALRRDWKRK